MVSFKSNHAQAENVNPSNFQSTEGVKKELVAGSFKSTLKSIGVLVDGAWTISQNDWEFSIPMTFESNGREEKVWFKYPKFKFSLDKDAIGNYANSKIPGCVVAGVIQHTPDYWSNGKLELGTETLAINYYHKPLIQYMVDLFSVYGEEIKKNQLTINPNSDVASKTKEQAAYRQVMSMLKVCELNSSKYEKYGVMEGETWLSENEAPTKNEKGYWAVEGKSLFTSKEDEYTAFYTLTDRSTMEFEEQAEFATSYVNDWTECFLNNVVKYLNPTLENTLNKGQVGYVPKAWLTKETKKDGVATTGTFFSIISNLRSLIVSIGSTKVGETWVKGTADEMKEYPDAKFWYGGMCGLLPNELGFKANGEYKSRLQFLFRAEPHRMDIEAFDVSVQKRSPFRNPFYLTNKPRTEEEVSLLTESENVAEIQVKEVVKDFKSTNEVPVLPLKPKKVEKVEPIVPVVQAESDDEELPDWMKD